MKILAVGIDPRIAEDLRQMGCLLERASVSEPDDLVDYLVCQYDACVISLDENTWGPIVCREIRLSKIKTPILGIYSGGRIAWSEYRALFLENGGDDLLMSPLCARELAASVRAVIRRTNGIGSDMVTVPFEGEVLAVDMSVCAVRLGGKVIKLTGKEYRILATMVRSSNRVLTKEHIFERLYVDGVDDLPELKIVDVFVCKLRTKLNNAHQGLGSIIETVWGQGYRFSTLSNSEPQQMLG